MNVDFLAGVRVLELGDGVAGASAAGLLCSLGAEVTAVVDPSSPHRSGRPRARHDGESLLAACLDRGKETVTVEGDHALEDLVGAHYEVVIVDRVLSVRGVLTPLAAVDDYAAFVERHNRGAWVTVSAFGLTGPRRRDVATELTVAAASGMLASVRDERTGQPLKLGGQQSLLNTGQAAALAACHGLDLAATGRPVHLDLSAVEATLATGPVLEVGALLLATGGAGGAKRYGAPASFYPCTDGLVRISAMEDHQWRGVVAAMGSPGWAEWFATVEARIAAPEEIDERVAAWTGTRAKREAESVLQSYGVPATAVYAPTEILDSPQLAHRQAFERLPLDGEREGQVVGLPIRVVSGGHDRCADRRRRRSLWGLRVLEASRVLAVPLAGSLLGALGAEVVKLEDLPRLDMYRRRGPYIEDRVGMEWSAYFALMNHSKASVAFDLDADRERLDSLISAADVVIENFGRKRAGALGMAASTAPMARPDLLAISSSGFGQDGPHADYRAYAYNLQASGALGYLTRDLEGDSAEIDIAWADLISAYALATIVAAWAVGPSGNAGAGIDFAMTDLVVSHFNEYLAAASLEGGVDDADRANEQAPFAPNGVYPTAAGWLALSIVTDEQYAGLVEVLGLERLSDGSDATAAGRFERRRELDERLAEVTSRHHAAVDLAADLRSAGVIAEAVMDAAALVADPQLDARGFFMPVDHADWGPRRIVGIPWRAYTEQPVPLSPPPRLGEGAWGWGPP